MAEQIQSIRREVMRRVYVVFFLRKVAKPLAIKGAFAVGFVAYAAALVSVRNVFWNMPSPAELLSFAKFIVSAFANTELAVQALTLGLAALAAFALLDLLRILRLFTLLRAVA